VDKRNLLLAFVLMMIVAVAPSIIWPPKKPAARPAGDTTAVQQREGEATSVSADRPRPSGSPSGSARPTVTMSDTGRIVWVTSPLYRLGFSTRGGRLQSAELLQYQSFAPGDSAQPVQLVPPGDAFLRHRLVLASGDTVSLDDWDFQPSPDESVVVAAGQSAKPLRFDAERAGSHVTLEYRFVPDQYRFDVQGSVSGLGGIGAVLLLDLSHGLRSVERDSLDDFRHYSVVTKASKTERTDFSRLRPGERTLINGPFEWVGVKSKYFFTAALALDEGQPTFGGAIAVGVPRNGKAASRADVMLTMPVPPAGTFRYSVYAGPLDYHQLSPMGHDLDDANPYGWSVFRPIIRPVSLFVTNILLWMHGRLHLAYGWALILFGIVIRLLLWPLNQKAMESGIRMQAVAPLLKETQDKYKNDPERLQREMVRLYKEHKVNPFGGCLPMLIPWPVLLALFFVFANTIIFRGVPFLWLPDLSRPDPFKIIPILLGLSMFGLSKVGQIGVPPNPQTKMMVYFMPLFMTVLFLNFASGLNLYYAAQNIFSIPQQYLIAKRRLREARVPAKT
jgi:YidC/Oxa1 family membrane protein insertase